MTTTCSEATPSCLKRQAFDVRLLFRRRGDNSKLRMIFLTDNGRRDERLLAILTPWDILGDPAE